MFTLILSLSALTFLASPPKFANYFDIVLTVNFHMVTTRKRATAQQQKAASDIKDPKNAKKKSKHISTNKNHEELEQKRKGATVVVIDERANTHHVFDIEHPSSFRLVTESTGTDLVSCGQDKCSLRASDEQEDQNHEIEVAKEVDEQQEQHPMEQERPQREQENQPPHPSESELTTNPCVSSDDRTIICQLKSFCCAGIFCKCKEEDGLWMPLASHSRCACCFCCMHGNCGYELEHMKHPIEATFQRICLKCTEQLLLKVHQPQPEASLHVPFLSGNDRSTVLATRCLQEIPPTLELHEQNTFPYGWNSVDAQHFHNRTTTNTNTNTTTTDTPSSTTTTNMTATDRNITTALNLNETTKNTPPNKAKKSVGPLNLRCNESIKQHYPKNYWRQQKLQPINSYRLSTSLFEKWINLSKEEQHQEKLKYINLSNKEKLAITEKIPGIPVSECKCIGCSGRKIRKDKDTTKGKRSCKRKVDNQKDPPEYRSMGHDGTTREEATSSVQNKKQRKLYHRKIGHGPFTIPDHARTIQQQGDETTLAMIHKSIGYFNKALTAATRDINGNDTNSGPTVQGVLIWKVQVAEAPRGGGKLPSGALSREKPLVYCCATNRAAFANVVNTIANPSFKREHEVVDLFGTGEEAMAKLLDHVMERKINRQRAAKLSLATSDVADNASDSVVFRETLRDN